jgi:hypothetical protein
MPAIVVGKMMQGPNITGLGSSQLHGIVTVHQGLLFRSRPSTATMVAFFLYLIEK